MRRKRKSRSQKASQFRYDCISRDVRDSRALIENDGLDFILQGKIPTGRVFISRRGYWLGTYHLRTGTADIGKSSQQLTFREFINAVRESHQQFLKRKSFAKA